MTRRFECFICGKEMDDGLVLSHLLNHKLDETEPKRRRELSDDDLKLLGSVCEALGNSLDEM